MKSLQLDNKNKDSNYNQDNESLNSSHNSNKGIGHQDFAMLPSKVLTHKLENLLQAKIKNFIDDDNLSSLQS